jgi:hypothetical protein
MSDETNTAEPSGASAGSHWRFAWIERFCDEATTVGVFLCIVGLFWVMADCSMRIGDLTSKYIHSRNAVAGEKEDSVMSASEIPFAWAVTANGRFIEAHGTRDGAMAAVTVRESQMAMIEGVPCEADGTPVEHQIVPLYRQHAATLRSLLERTK